MATKKLVVERVRKNSQRKKEIGARLLRLRKAKFKNAEQAFEALSASGFQRGLDSYKAYEKGAREIPADEARLALEVFQSPEGSFDWLFLGDEEPEWGGQAQRIAARPSLVMLPRLTAREAAMIPLAFETVKEQAKKENRLQPVASRPGHEIGPKSFLMPIEDDSMVPTFPYEERRFLPGDDVLIDPDVRPKPGDFVCAHVKSQSTAIFRKWQESDSRFDPEKHFVLKPLNSNYSTETVNPKTNPGRVIGCMIQHISYRR
jgi:SOS-response transcriptional repressor LexA